MDPEATLAELTDALRLREWDRIEELADALLGWMERSGFPPTTVGTKELGVQWHRAVATFVCHAAKSKVKDARKRRARKREA